MQLQSRAKKQSNNRICYNLAIIQVEQRITYKQQFLEALKSIVVGAKVIKFDCEPDIRAGAYTVLY